MQVRAPNLDDIFKLLRLRGNRIVETLHRRNQVLLHRGGRGNVHGCREGVVRRLRHVHVIVGVNGLFAAHLAARKLDRAVRNHLIDIHVRLRARTRLPYAQGKLVFVLARNHLVGRADDQLHLVFREFTQVMIYQRGCFLEKGKGTDQLRRHAVFANCEVVQ